MMSHVTALVPAEIAAAAPPASGSQLFGILPLILLFVAMYFFMIAPQRKKQKEHQKMLSTLKSGDDVVTSGGIYGTITNVKDDRFIIRISDTTKIEVGKGFIQSVIAGNGDDGKK
ncbi:MAG: preprotein translocase subunit YajC [Opitutaceae bacterium]